MEKRIRVNIGCGLSPVHGWVNFDNSPSLKLSRRPVFAKFLKRIRLLNAQQQQAIDFFRTSDVQWANAAKRIPLPDDSVEVLYSSHMLEHLDRTEAQKFLIEARRVLCPGGILRLAVPDLRRLVEQYISTGDADQFLSRTDLVQPRPETLGKQLLAAFVGNRSHHWMYDGTSLIRLLERSEFRDATACPAGETQITNPEGLNLREREGESVYVEARK